MKRLLGLICMMVVLGLSSNSFALDPMVIGNFELPIDGDGDGNDDRYEDWMSDWVATSVTSPAITVTLGTKSLKLVDDDGGWDTKISMPFGEYGGTLEENARANAMCQEFSAWSIDVTVFPGEVAGDSLTLAMHGEGSGLGWGLQTPDQSIIVDGQPHTYVIVIPQTVKDALNPIDGYCNLGFGFSTASGSATIYVDNITIHPDGYTPPDGPYGRSEEQVFHTGEPTKVDVTFKWKAAKDPNEDTTGNAVNPDIVDQYVFIRETSSTDPNLYYIGATGVDPGTTDPNSQFGPVILNADSAYSWTVVEAMDGLAQTFTVDSSLLDVDPNNIIGPKWNFNTLSNLPVINTQPASKRFGVNDASVQLTIGVTSATQETYQWYFSTDNVIGGDIAIAAAAGGDTNTVTFTTHNKAYQAYYYCEVSNLATGTTPVRSKMVSIVVERKVAEYLFNGNLSDTSGMLFDGTGVGSPTFVTGVGGSGQALSLNGTSQYIEIGNPADPNTFNKAFPRADLFTNVNVTNVDGGVGTEIGSGGGLDVGSILCWVKLNATAADQVSPIMANSNGGWPHTEFNFGITTDAAAANTNLREYIWNNSGNLSFWMDVNPAWADPFNMGGDGQWHMLAVTWNTGNAKSYLDGNLLASWDASSGEFSVWDSTMTIGFDGTNYFSGAIDNLRVYNYEVTAEDIVAEASAITGEPGCIIHDFAGSNLNVNQLGTSYCKVDLADFAEFAANWLNDGFYQP
jgi:hypothetical protein